MTHLLHTLPVGSGTFLVIVTAYLSIVIPCTILDQWGPFAKSKIQPHRTPPTAKEYKQCAKMVAINFSWLLPATISSTSVLELFVKPMQNPSTPISFLEMVVSLAMFWLVDDLFFYWYHRAFHHPALYATFHKPHHVFTAPFAACSYATHPVELMCQAIGATLGPFFLYPVVFRENLCPVELFWTYLFLRQIQGLEDHIGWDIWFSPTRMFGGTLHHDIHHQKFVYNYASTFAFLDQLFGTDYKM